MILPRRVFVKIEYNGKDITAVLSNSAFNLQYIDKASNEADELTLNFHDKKNNWIGDWYPKLITGDA